MAELLKVARPDLLKDWDFEKNAGVSLNTIRVNAGNKVSWRCQADNRHRWEARVRNRAIDGNGCPYCSGRKTLREESFGVLYPKIAAELHATKNPQIDRFAISPGSNKAANWVCPNGHEWKSEIARRVRTKSGCPKCARVKGRPMLAQSPLASEFHPTKNGKLKVELLTLGTRRRVWWQCATDPMHAWLEAVNYRRKTGNRCPGCYPRGSGRRESLDKFSDALCREWHPSLNAPRVPKDFTVGSGVKVWWQCVKISAHPAWQSAICNRTIHKQGCPKCAARAFDEKHSIAMMFPELAAEWHSTKNAPWTPANVTFGSSRNMWWRCTKDPTHEWQRVVNVRTKRNTGCPLCSGQAVTLERSLAVCFPKIAAEWHPTKNGDLTPEMLKAKSAKKVFWQCTTNPTHEWEAQIKNRTINGSGCPHCARDNNILKIQQELNKAAFNTTEVYRTFLFSIRNLESLSKSPPEKSSLRALFHRMLYAQTITALEAYLSDSFLKLVVNRPEFKKRLLSEAAGFKEKKFTLAEILDQDPTSDEAIAAALSEILWHKISRVKTLFSLVCGVELPTDIFPLLKAVANRHDIVHRSGKSTKGVVVAIGDREVRDLFSVVKGFARDIESKLSAMATQ